MAATLLVRRDKKLEQTLVLIKEYISIGRRSHNDLVLEELSVSGNHAAIQKIMRAFYIEDLRSTNGTKLNGQRIDKVELHHKDVITIDGYEIEFLNEDPQGAFLRILNGVMEGQELVLEKQFTTIGQSGVVLIGIRRHAAGHSLEVIEGEERLRINGLPAKVLPYLLSRGDIVDLAGTHMQVFL